MEGWSGISAGCISQCRIPLVLPKPHGAIREGRSKRDENAEKNPVMCREQAAALGFPSSWIQAQCHSQILMELMCMEHASSKPIVSLMALPCPPPALPGSSLGIMSAAGS